MKTSKDVRDKFESTTVDGKESLTNITAYQILGES